MKKFVKKPVLLAISLLGRGLGKRYDKAIDKKRVNNILIFCLGGFGDNLLMFPVIKSLQTAFPHSQFHLITDSLGTNLFELYPSNSLNFITFEMTGKHKSIQAKLKFFKRIKRTLSIDLLYNAHRGNGMIEHTIMSYLTGARYRLGFTKKGTGFLFTTKIEFSDSESILLQNISLLKSAKISTPMNPSIDISIPSHAAIFARQLLNRHKDSKNSIIVALHTGADWHPRLKCWPLQHYLDLAREICTIFPAKILLLGSKNEERALKPIIEGLENSKLVNVVGRTSIAQLAALIGYSDLFIGNDSGPLHLSLALNTPTVGIFGATSPTQLLPKINNNCVPVRVNLPCSPCYLHQPFFRATCNDVRCLSMIQVNHVLNAVTQLVNHHDKREHRH